jgi:hypothetical protein
MRSIPKNKKKEEAHMPAISKIRFTNVLYEEGNKRYNDEVFQFDGHNGAILLENGGGKTVFIQTAIQVVLPHTDLAGRKMKDTLSLENGPAHIAIEWIVHERPRRYAVTCISLFLTATGIDSYRYIYDYSAHDPDSIDHIPFAKETAGKQRAADKGEIHDYYQGMTQKRMNAKLMPTIKEYKQALEQEFHIIPSEWERIAKINSSEGGVEHFFDECKSTAQLFDRLLIPTVEEAMSGFEQGEFANSFEAHRDGFKKYKELKEKVEENQKIVQEIERYVRSFARLYSKQQDYAAAQSEAKAYWLLANAHKEEEADKLDQLQEQLAQCETKLIYLAQKKDSLLIAKQKQELSVCETKLNLADEDLQVLEEQVRETRQVYYSLRLAEYKQQALQAEERMNYVRLQMEQLDRTQEEDELQEAWTRNSAQLRGLFLSMEEGWRLEEDRRKANITAHREMESNEATVMTELEQQMKELMKRVTENETLLKTRDKDRAELRRSILANPDAESIEGNLAGWIQSQQKLDESNMQLIQQNKELAASKESNTSELEQIHESLKQEYKEYTILKGKLDDYTQAHQMIIKKLAAIRPAWGRLSSVYEKQSSIEGHFIDDIEKLRKEKETLLHKERLAFRYIDDYSRQDTFFADSYVAELIGKWENQFSLLETGNQYLQNIGHTDAAAIHPLWSVTMITTEEEIKLLTSKLQTQTDSLQYPIQVISSQQASRIVQDEALISTAAAVWIEPRHWQSNTDAASFANWKQSINQAGEEIRSIRTSKEQELRHFEGVQTDFLRFIDTYSLELIQERELQFNQKREGIQQLEGQAERLAKFISQIEQEVEKHQRTLADQKDEMHQLQQWIEKGHKYLELGKEIQGLKKDTEQLQEQISSQRSKWNSRDRSLQHIKKRIEQWEAELRGIELERKTFQGQELYEAVREAIPLISENSLDWLKNERKDLNLKLLHISQGRQQLHAELEHAKQRKSSLDKEILKLLQEHSDLLEELEFPLSGEEQMNELRQRQRSQEERLDRLKGEHKRIEQQFIELKSKINHLVDQYAKDHQRQQPIHFFEALYVLEDQIQVEDKQLRTEKQALTQLSAQMNQQLTTIEELIQYFNQYKIMHGFENPQVIASTLAQDAQTAFIYNRMGTARKFMTRLIADNESLRSEENAVKKARLQFIDFCRKSIQDVKLREMAEQGVEQRDSYQEIVEFQQTMQTRIQRVNHIAEETMRTHNQQLEQFIVHVHGHVKLIAAELRDIPNKTRVKVEDQWKHIYTFSIPEWDELEGKSSLRKHLEWILDQLEKDKYREDNGQELKYNVRKDLEKWLDTKQLLQIVLQERPLKVSCRKVTNENNVTKAAFSWEQSNNWSGGEKWSKNMTLFLGLLNYVAEKRQHIQSHMKRHRTVILDNPFGKASSDHVLSPVFFIAEQLGFQLIALTAHAEGKFLKDYFPIVFSCRLRQAANSSKQVVTKVKEINQAYFRDHAPVSLERLGDVKQLELFV